MEDQEKIQKAWEYFKIQDDEVLIIQCFNPKKGDDEFCIARKQNGKIISEVVGEWCPETMTDNFVLVKYRGNGSLHDFPPIEELGKETSCDF